MSSDIHLSPVRAKPYVSLGIQSNIWLRLTLFLALTAEEYDLYYAFIICNPSLLEEKFSCTEENCLSLLRLLQ